MVWRSKTRRGNTDQPHRGTNDQADVRSHGPRLQNRLINISLKNCYVWFKIGKAGCTSMATALNVLELADLPNTKAPAHAPALQSPFVKPYQLPPAMLDDILTGDDFFKFAVVRNPYARLLSAYLDKIDGRRKERRLIESALGRSADDDISFAEFIGVITTSRTTDPHWMRQTRIVGPRLDAALHLESLNEELSKLPTVLCEHLSKTLRKRAPHATGADALTAEHYTPEIVAVVKDFYADDFERFGYSTELP